MSARIVMAGLLLVAIGGARETPAAEGKTPGSQGQAGLVESSLIANASLEKGIDGWFAVRGRAQAARLPPGTAPAGKTLSARYRVDKAGVESFRSARMDISATKGWGAWVVRLKGIKPRTNYTLSFWYRQSWAGVPTARLFDSPMKMPQPLAENPAHWVRYSITLNSREHEGQALLVFLAQSKDVPVWAGMDEVYLYEGSSPIGYNRVELHYQYYNTLLVSPDVTSPMSFRFEYQFFDTREPLNLQYVLELPAEIAAEDFWLSYGSPYWRTIAKREDESFIREGKPWKRHTVSLRRPLGQARAQWFMRPVGRRDRITRTGYGSYSGLTTMAWYLSTRLMRGERYGYYYARWPATSRRPAGRQPPRKFRIKVVRVPEAPKLTRLKVYQDISASPTAGHAVYA